MLLNNGRSMGEQGSAQQQLITKCITALQCAFGHVAIPRSATAEVEVSKPPARSAWFNIVPQ
jgi:hypothetical protein